MRVLLTGGLGFIGSITASTLAKYNNVIIYDIGTWDTKSKNIEYIKGDIFDFGHLVDISKHCDCVIHMVGLPDARMAQEHPQMSFDLNVRSLQVLLEAMRNNHIPRLVLPSSAVIYGVPDQLPVKETAIPKLAGIYAFHKYMSEKLAEAYSSNFGIKTTILRLFNVYGTKGGGILNILIDKAIKGEPVKLYGEKQKRDFIHVSDVAEAFTRVLDLEHQFEIYNLGTGTGRSIEDLVNLVRDCVANLSIEPMQRNDVLYDSVADISKIERAINFNPDTSDKKLRSAISAMSKWS
jgi:nucleoside-diphosphate-sugar epimerase